MFVYILYTHSKDALFKKKIVREMKFHVVVFSTVVMCVCLYIGNFQSLSISDFKFLDFE